MEQQLEIYKQKMIQDGVVSASVAGLVQLIL